MLVLRIVEFIPWRLPAAVVQSFGKAPRRGTSGAAGVRTLTGKRAQRLGCPVGWPSRFAANFHEKSLKNQVSCYVWDVSAAPLDVPPVPSL